ncbi:MAG: hypothetical protein ACYC7D_06680 [Nitrososphaerales archaeon]
MLISLIPVVYNQPVTRTTQTITATPSNQSSTFTSTSLQNTSTVISKITSSTSSTSAPLNVTENKVRALVLPAATMSNLSSGFSSADLSLINSTASLQIQFIESLQMPNGAIIESPGDSVVYTRDMALAAIALTLAGHLPQAESALNYILSLPQGASNYTGPQGSSFSSPAAWSQIYSVNSETIDPSLRGEDQGMVLFAISTYVDRIDNLTLAKDHWDQIQSAANFILYLQHSPETSVKFDGLYRHGDNWHDSRPENRAGSQPIYWPYWPEYYQWEEENMRMINGLRGAITLAQTLGFSSDAQKWNNSLNAALIGLSNESMYNKYEAYDYFGSVLWGIQTNLQAEKNIMNQIPSSFFTAYGVKDLPWENYAGASDTIDYMVCLVRIGNLAGASRLLHIIATNYVNPAGGFYDSIYANGSHSTSPSELFSSARFIYFAYVVS